MRCDSVSTSVYDDEEVETFYVELEKFYNEDHTLVVVGRFNVKIGRESGLEKLHIGNKVWGGTSNMKHCLSSSRRPRLSMKDTAKF